MCDNLLNVERQTIWGQPAEDVLSKLKSYSSQMFVKDGDVVRDMPLRSDYTALQLHMIEQIAVRYRKLIQGRIK